MADPSEFEEAYIPYNISADMDRDAQQAAVRQAAHLIDRSQIPSGQKVVFFPVPEGAPPPPGEGWDKIATFTPDGYNQPFDVHARSEMLSPPSNGPEALQDIERDFANIPPGEPQIGCDDCVGEPGFWEGMIPIWGSGRDAINAFQKGEIGWGIFHSVMAASDVFMVGALAKMAGKALIKTGVREVGEEVGEKALKEGAEGVAERARIWTPNPNKGMNRVENAFSHWKKHQKEFPEYRNAKEYVEGAKGFMDNPPPGTLRKVRSNGDELFYNPSSNTFAIRSAERAPRTMFRPKKRMEYWDKQ